MSEHDTTENGAGRERITLTHDALVDEVVLQFDRLDGTMTIGGKMCNLEVALDMCHRAARHFETQLRIQAAQGAKQAMVENARVVEMLNRARGGSH